MVAPILLLIILIRSEYVGKIKKTLFIVLLIIPSSLFSYLNSSTVVYDKIKLVLIYCMLVILLVPRFRPDIEPSESNKKEV